MAPTEHAFEYRLFMMFLDLAELDTMFKGRWLWSSSRSAPARFRREDHLGDPALPLADAVRDLVARETGARPTGPIRLLTHLRYFGYCFNPVSFYYCYDARAERVETIIAEVNNTPWGERHCYVLSEPMNIGRLEHKRYAPTKQMHVSPFMPMAVAYDWRFSTPGERLAVHMQVAKAGVKLFDATLDLERIPITAASLARTLIAYPLMTLKVIVAIHWQALRLWLKRTPIYDHPAHSTPLKEKSA
jgi:uncharacterized protein